MASETEMREVILHAAKKLNVARDSTITCKGTHQYSRTLTLTVDAYVAMAYAESILRLLASYLKVEEPSSNGHTRMVDPRPRDEQGRFLKSAETGGVS